MQRRRRGKEEGHKRYFKVRADSSRMYLIVFNCLIVVTTHYILSRGGKPERIEAATATATTMAAKEYKSSDPEDKRIDSS